MPGLLDTYTQDAFGLFGDTCALAAAEGACEDPIIRALCLCACGTDSGDAPSAFFAIAQSAPDREESATNECHPVIQDIVLRCPLL